jgi:hypothetical protein
MNFVFVYKNRAMKVIEIVLSIVKGVKENNRGAISI